MATANLRGDTGLLHLFQAATALTQLVGTPNGVPPPPSQLASSRSSSASPLPVTAQTASPGVAPAQRNASTHSISDDDETLSSKMASLRENHLQALRAASKQAVAAVAAVSSRPVVTIVTQPQLSTFIVQQETKPTNSSSRASSSKGEKEVFPMRLHALLADPDVRDVISWLPHGNSFVVLRPDVFATRVLPQYFNSEVSIKAKVSSNSSVTSTGSKPQVHKYPSFTRKLNRWGFRQISRGADAGAFCHELFKRDEPELCRGMVCQKSRKSSKSSVGGSAKSVQSTDDCKSISSASTISVASGEKRHYSAAVTVSTLGASTATKSLPFKKRRAIVDDNNYMMGIPANVEMKPNNRNNHTLKRSFHHSDSETASNLSDNGSVSSNFKSTAASTTLGPTSAEAAAKEALARHFHQQHRAFALASLMENSRLAMEAIGMKKPAAAPATNAASSSRVTSSAMSVVQPAAPSRRESLGATTHSAVFAPTVSLPEPNESASLQEQHCQSAEAAKTALFQAYVQALSSTP